MFYISVSSWDGGLATSQLIQLLGVRVKLTTSSTPPAFLYCSFDLFADPLMHFSECLFDKGIGILDLMAFDARFLPASTFALGCILLEDSIDN